MGIAKLKDDRTIAAANDAGAPRPPAVVVKLRPTGGGFAATAKRWGTWTLVNCIPPLITVLLLLLVWQIAFSGPKSSLPAPTVVWKEAGDLITQPFYWAGSQDIGLGWRVATSLERVAIGFGLAAIVGVAIGAIIGQSIWAMRGLDPVFQVLRTVPPLAWLPISLAAFRDANPSAIFVIFITAIWPIIINTAVGIRNIPQDYRNVAAVLRLNSIEFFFKVMLPSAAPTSSRACASASACPGSPSWRRRC